MLRLPSFARLSAACPQAAAAVSAARCAHLLRALRGRSGGLGRVVVPCAPFSNQRRNERARQLVQLKTRHQSREEYLDIAHPIRVYNRNWAMKSGVVVERCFRVFPPYEPWMLEYDAWQQKNMARIGRDPPIELSGLSEEELAKAKVEGLKRPSLEEELKKIGWEPEPLETDADRANDRHSLNRQLTKRLYLLVKKPREEHAWQFPQGSVEQGETLRAAAQRELAEECGSALRVHILGNAPIGHVTYPYPPEFAKQQGRPGAKVFFYHALYLENNVQVDNKEIVDFAWVSKAEMKDYLDPELLKLVQTMILD